MCSSARKWQLEELWDLVKVGDTPKMDLESQSVLGCVSVP